VNFDLTVNDSFLLKTSIFIYLLSIDLYSHAVWLSVL